MTLAYSLSLILPFLSQFEFLSSRGACYTVGAQEVKNKLNGVGEAPKNFG